MRGQKFRGTGVYGGVCSRGGEGLGVYGYKGGGRSAAVWGHERTCNGGMREGG